MTYLTLPLIKKHLNIDDYYEADNTYLEQLGDAAEVILAQHLESDLASIAADNEGSLPAPLIQAMLLMVGTLYISRETITFGSAMQIPLGWGGNAYQYLIDPYINYKNSAR